MWPDRQGASLQGGEEMSARLVRFFRTCRAVAGLSSSRLSVWAAEQQRRSTFAPQACGCCGYFYPFGQPYPKSKIANNNLANAQKRLELATLASPVRRKRSAALRKKGRCRIVGLRNEITRRVMRERAEQHKYKQRWAR